MGRADYSERLLEHFHEPRGVGDVPDPDAVGEAVGPDDGDRLRLSFRIEDRVVREVRFRCRGCVVAIAAGSAAVGLLVGRTLEAARALTDEDVADALGGVPDDKKACSILVRRAVREALGEGDRGVG